MPSEFMGYHLWDTGENWPQYKRYNAATSMLAINSALELCYWSRKTTLRSSYPLKIAKHHGIDLIHKSRNAPLPYPTMHHPEQKCAHFCSEWYIVGWGTGALWDLWDWSISVYFVDQISYITVLYWKWMGPENEFVSLLNCLYTLAHTGHH